MNVNYTEICRVGNLEADFQQVSLVHFFSEIFTILFFSEIFSICVCETAIIKIQQLKVNQYFLRQKLKKKITML